MKVKNKYVTHSDGWRGYNGLVDFGYKKHFRVHYSKNEFARGNSHINGILIALKYLLIVCLLNFVK
jgi:hypothetical protein